jgi:protein required for attachment to host cells
MSWAPDWSGAQQFSNRFEARTMKPNKTWVVVADGAHAKFLLWHGLKSGASAIPEQSFEQHTPRTRDLGRDKPGRTQDSFGRARHAIEPKVDTHEEAEKEFLRIVVRRLFEAFEGGSFDEFVLIAPPRAIGVIRDLLPHQLKSGMTLQIVKDLTKHTDQAISDFLRIQLESGDFKTKAHTP